MYCSECGKKADADSKFCIGCGNSVGRVENDSLSSIINNLIKKCKSTLDMIANNSILKKRITISIGIFLMTIIVSMIINSNLGAAPSKRQIINDLHNHRFL